MERKKLFVRIGIGAAGSAAGRRWCSPNAPGEYNAMRQGFQGFPLRGTYQGDPQQGGIGTIAFQTFDGEPSVGRIEAAQSEQQRRVQGNRRSEHLRAGRRGWQRGGLGASCVPDAHENRALYVRYGSDDLVEMRKVDSVPSRALRLTCVSLLVADDLRVERRRALAIPIQFNASTKGRPWTFGHHRQGCGRGSAGSRDAAGDRRRPGCGNREDHRPLAGRHRHRGPWPRVCSLRCRKRAATP